MMAKSVVIIEDLDRIVPAHLFRIMNVLSSQVDNPYYSEVPHRNKFGFDKIILVMDYELPNISSTISMVKRRTMRGI